MKSGSCGRKFNFFLSPPVRLFRARGNMNAHFKFLLKGFGVALVIVVCALASAAVKAKRRADDTAASRSRFAEEQAIVSARMSGATIGPGLTIRSANYDVATNVLLYIIEVGADVTIGEAFKKGVKVGFWQNCSDRSDLFSLRGSVAYRYVRPDSDQSPPLYEVQLSAHDCPTACTAAAIGGNISDTTAICRVFADPDYKELHPQAH